LAERVYLALNDDTCDVIAGQIHALIWPRRRQDHAVQYRQRHQRLPQPPMARILAPR
jgi:hypothetical protein